MPLLVAACVPVAGGPTSTTTTTIPSTTTTSTTTTSSPPANTTFDLLVVAVYGTDQQPGSARLPHVRLAAEQSAAYFETVSRGRLDTTGTAASHVVDGTVTPWFRVPMNLASTCGHVQLLQTMAPTLTVLRSEGIDPSRYERIVVFSHQSPTCSWGGGAWPFHAQTGVTSLLDVFTIVHELGHSLGLTHMHARDCPASIFPTTGCTYQEYGGRFDPMGQTFPVPVGLSTLSLSTLGWLDAGSIEDVSTDGTYRVASPYVETAQRTARMLRFTAAGKSYALEYRPAVGPDAPFGTPPHLADTVPGVVLYEVAARAQLDATPGSQANDMADGSIAPGRAVLAPGGLSIEVVAQDSTTAIVRFTGFPDVAP